MARYGICFTFNNYTPQDILNIQGAIGQRGITYICYGRETGAEGTPHLQGYLQGTQKQFSRLQQTIGRCHMEAAKAESGPSMSELEGVFGEPYTAIGYCMKDGDFWEAGTKVTISARKNRQGKRSDIDAVLKDIQDGHTYDEICDAHFETASRINKFIKERVQARDSNEQVNSLREQFESASLKPWQQALLDVVNEDPCPRKIHWIWENGGNVGKSWMATYLGVLHQAVIMTPAKKANMAYTLVGKKTKIVIFDLSRTNEPVDGKSWLDGTYSLAEEIKNGRVFSPMYGGQTIWFKPCHVIFFANFEPDYTKWSPDRYNVIGL